MRKAASHNDHPEPFHGRLRTSRKREIHRRGPSPRTLGRRQANQQPWYERLGRGAEAAGVHDVGDEEERSTSHIMRSMDAYTTDRARRQTHSRQAPGGAAKGRCTQTQHLQESTHGKRHAAQRCILCRFASQRTGQVDSPQTRKARGNPNPSPGLQLLLLLHPPSPRVKYARQACILAC